MERADRADGRPYVLEVAGRAPTLDPTAFVAPTAVLAGAVRLAAAVSVWHHAVLRADLDTVDVGEGSNIQDGAVLHADPGFPVRIGERVTIGHNATVHGCHVEDDVLVGMGAIVLDGARIGPWCILAAGTVVPQHRHIPARSVVAGPAATIVRSATDEDLDAITTAAQVYRGLADLHGGNVAGVAR
ncbi:gamma carbonic anhydrase family protein [Streptomyces sp. UH6]|uniref:gamma carbonic anhydrase family protein n=1 Tax=Streptomyces sp. UH6 TaxID=2748379 RepID=UPI00280BCF64|nr:gamma carbonic anhydrase family protein [Streptomyces sp. UH6]